MTTMQIPRRLIMLGLLLCASASGAAELEQQRQEAAAVTQTFMDKLMGTMQQEMRAGGPTAAIKVCTEQAPAIAGQLSREHGWRVTRVGTRVRNPMLGMPDSWEQQVLAQFQQRKDDGEALKGMNHAEVVSEPGGRYFRFMAAIGIQPRCLTCHGPLEQIPEAVRTLLSEHYPHDTATGYQEGDLRGAVSIKYPLDKM